MGLKGATRPGGQLRSQPQPRRFRFKLMLYLGLPLLIPILWLGYRQVQSYFDHPQAVLVLGGAPEREDFAAIFARQYPELPIWVSGGSNPEYTEGTFADAGIDMHRLHIDRAAVDTVTNFTTIVDQLQAKGINSVYVITSDYHMRRARVIGEIVFGSRGITVKPVVVPSHRSSIEPMEKSIRDGARAILWLLTGHTGASLSRQAEATIETQSVR
ncbi:YdcF family protein [Pantanalinema rosaneae CENA516]|uniref:YdcF family protein n=1 Tax=Pantanalinema rosaneae TaxID=1620701 RepID=UPI003D6ED5EE